MLTAAQHKLKRELEELQANALFHSEPEPFPPARKNVMKKRVYITMGILAVIVICSFFMMSILTPNHKKIVSYLSSEQQYYRKSEKLFSEYTLGDEQIKSDQDALLKKVSILETPSGLKDHKQDVLDVMEQQKEMLTLFANSGNSNLLTLNKKLMELHVKQELALDSLLKVFKREKMRYIINEDGTIQYWVDGKVYTY
ncbi:hypothetical protein BABA_01335 [Neobacillus bataviensis LMG 21833]|uniref:Uncharacterized protein n=1 Tax=Neobacillus bataviensis LMG 21833 TaxID=1117379 RepID=K6DG25_9BACI|nr:hypothetical protein [Neobacillus bataviensis]EKN71502.1 hypothetical protein BABA_01335 [Neobacillus bataviensis LMG 21833]